MKKLLSLGAVLALGLSVASAAPPGSPYNLGETLDPACAPNSANCTVVPPAASGVNSDITQLDGVDEIWIGADEATAQNTNFKTERTLNVETTNTDDSTGWAPINLFDTYVEPATGQAAGATRIGLAGYGTVPAGNTNQVQSIHGTEGGAENYGTGSVHNLSGLVGWAYNAANAAINVIYGTWSGVEHDDGTVTDMHAYTADYYIYGGTVNNLRGLYLGSGDVGGGTIVNRYGIHIDTPNGAVTGSDYGVYQSSFSQQNVFSGNTGIGTSDVVSPLTVQSAASVKLAGGFASYHMNSYFDTNDTRDEYIDDGYASRINQDNAARTRLQVADTGVADNAITWVNAVNIDNTNGYVGIGAGADNPKATLTPQSEVGIRPSNNGFGTYYVNAYYDQTDMRVEYMEDGYAAQLSQNDSSRLLLSVADTGTADGAVTWTDALNINNANGYVGFNASPDHPINMSSGAHVTAGGVWTDASSRELKDDIQDLSSEQAYDTLSKLEPKTYHYKVTPEEQQVGFIAEDVPDLVATNDRKSLAPMDIVGVLTKVVQDQQAQIEAQNQRLEQLEAALNDLR